MKKINISLTLFYLSVFLIIFFLTSHQMSGHGYQSDLLNHLFFVERIHDGKTYIPHPLWHLCVYYMKYITLNKKCAASLVTSLFTIFWVYIVQYIYTYFTNRKDKYLLLYLFIIFIIGPAYIPSLTKFIFIGTGGPNVWHNITLFAVKPFALLSLFITVLALEQKKISYYIIGVITLFISIFAKPSYVIAFLPALTLFMLIKRFFEKENIIYFIVLSVISVASLGYQFSHTYENSDSSVIVDFLGVWSRYTPSVTLSIILALMFPLIYFIVNFKNSIKNNYITITWIMTVISILYAAFLAESGPRYNHGNFFWSYMISLTILYIFTIADYFKNYNHFTKYKRGVLNIILFWQVLVGLYYFIIVMKGYDAAGPFDISLLFK